MKCEISGKKKCASPGFSVSFFRVMDRSRLLTLRSLQINVGRQPVHEQHVSIIVEINLHSIYGNKFRLFIMAFQIKRTNFSLIIADEEEIAEILPEY